MFKAILITLIASISFQASALQNLSLFPGESYDIRFNQGELTLVAEVSELEDQDGFMLENMILKNGGLNGFFIRAGEDYQPNPRALDIFCAQVGIKIGAPEFRHAKILKRSAHHDLFLDQFYIQTSATGDFEFSDQQYYSFSYIKSIACLEFIED